MLASVIVPSIVLIAIILAWAYRRAGKVRPLACSDVVGPVEYDFAKSFAANFTVLGAIVGAVLATSALPVKDDKVHGADFAALHVTLLLLTAAGPIVYNALRTRSEEGQKGVYQGTVCAFLAGVAVIGVASLGQALALLRLASEIYTSKPELETAMIVFGVIAGVTLLGLARYLYQCTVSSLLPRAGLTDAQAGAPPWTIP